MAAGKCGWFILESGHTFSADGGGHVWLWPHHHLPLISSVCRYHMWEQPPSVGQRRLDVTVVPDVEWLQTVVLPLLCLIFVLSPVLLVARVFVKSVSVNQQLYSVTVEMRAKEKSRAFEAGRSTSSVSPLSSDVSAGAAGASQGDRGGLGSVLRDLVKPGDENLREMNKKLQNMLEEQLTKNMHLQKVTCAHTQTHRHRFHSA